MKVVKSRAFKGAYIIKESDGEIRNKSKYVDHVFLNDIKCNGKNVEVQYVCYSARYRKWYQDTMCMSKDKYQEIRKCANI